MNYINQNMRQKNIKKNMIEYYVKCKWKNMYLMKIIKMKHDNNI